MSRQRFVAAAGCAVLAAMAGRVAQAAPDPLVQPVVDVAKHREPVRKLPYITLYERGVARHLATFKAYPPKRIVDIP